jgi:hypothetical protein
MKKHVADMDESCALLNTVGEEWIGSGSNVRLETLVRRTLKKISNDPHFNLAVYLKYNFGHLCTGEDNESWLETAKNISKILGEKNVRK